MATESSNSRPGHSGSDLTPGPTLVVRIGEPDGSRAAAAALACEAAGSNGAALFIDLGGPAPRPTLTVSVPANDLQESIADGLPDAAAAARGRLCHISFPADSLGLGSAARAIELAGNHPAVIHLPSDLLGWAIDGTYGLSAAGALLLADPAADRSLVTTLVQVLRASGLEAVVLKKRLGWVAERRALFGALPPDHADGLPRALVKSLLRPRIGAIDAGAVEDGLTDRPPIVVVRGGVAEPIRGDALVLDFDVTSLRDHEAVALDLAAFRDKREQAVRAGAPPWLVEEIDDTISELEHSERDCRLRGGGSR